MVAIAESVALIGTEAQLVRVEVGIGQGLPGFRIVGLPNASVREAEQRVRSALLAADEKWSKLRITANLAPGALRKEGTHFDLALALGVAGADKEVQLSGESLQGWVCVGELALDGKLREVPGVLAAASACRAEGRRGVICPVGNAAEAALVEGIEVVAIRDLRHVLDFLNGNDAGEKIPPPDTFPPTPLLDLRSVRGHHQAKQALEVAAAGGHNLMMVGPPGSGKTMLAQRMPGILPPMSFEESLEVTQIHSVAGALPKGAPLITERPFRSPHHHISLAGMVGGGSGLPRPGELSLAHHGTLFLDEVSLFRRDILESMRGPLEDGHVRIARSGGMIAFPCRFSLIAAMNPCPCGYLGDSVRECECGEIQLHSYRSKLSGPLLDRMDIQTTMERSTSAELLGLPQGDSSNEVRARVVAAREMQTARYGDPTINNASAPRRVLDDHISLGREGRVMLAFAIESGSLTGRGLDRVLRVARTLADLERAERVDEVHLSSALGLRLETTSLRVAS